jgi:hypothetical protein
MRAELFARFPLRQSGGLQLGLLYRHHVERLYVSRSELLGLLSDTSLALSCSIVRGEWEAGHSRTGVGRERRKSIAMCFARYYFGREDQDRPHAAGLQTLR